MSETSNDDSGVVILSNSGGKGDTNNNTVVVNGEIIKANGVGEESDSGGGGEDGKSSEATAASKEAAENELILIQDNAFSIKISVSGLDVFDLQVTSMELVQEINQMLMDKEETCHRTCFSLQLDGVALDNFSELKSIEGLKEGAMIKLVDGILRENLIIRYISFF